jgi:hypothetical protein
MDARRIFQNACYAALVLASALTLLALWHSSSVPDLASGRTEALLIAPVISASLSYVTVVDAWMVAGAHILALVCFLVWMALEARRRLGWGE